ncbi:MAG: hypothetical protein KY457_02425 [Actinobacteria bacterium]|nr:hypothetical protein [Actinomycetota bacterium]
MTVTVSTELYIQATPEAVAASLVDDRTSGLAVTREGSWHLAPWSPSLDSWRHDVSWRRGRARGSGTIDLLPAGVDRTLAIVTLSTRACSLRSILAGEAAALARRLRVVAERGGAVPTADRPDVATIAGRVGPPVAAAVGYSGP